MELPSFKLTQYGVFDSRIVYKNVVTTPERIAKEYEIEIFNEDCSGRSFIDEYIVPIKRGTIIVTKPGSKRHSLFPIKCLNIHLIALNKEAEKIFESLPSILNSNNISDYEKVFNEMLVTDLSDKQLFNLFLNKFVMQILIFLKRDIAIEDCSTNVKNNKSTLLKIEKYLQNNFNQQINLESLAKQANMSPAYFHKLFTAYFNKTPNDYLLNVRISHAKILLLNNNYSLSDIAFSCGFSSQSYFCLKFKKEVGKTPLVYRNEELTRLKY